MRENFDLQAYLTAGVEKIVAASLKAVLRDPLESAFMIRFAAAARRASKMREAAEQNGEHIPAFLIASITSSCNLHCAGCYSRCNHATQDAVPVGQLSAEKWLGIFREASELGISFIILAGGEPMMRPDVLEAAGKVKDILFPVFTNGTCLTEKTLELFRKCRNLLPVISLEGDAAQTDARRGKGVHARLTDAMRALRERGLPFGISVTVTAQNVGQTVSDAFLEDLASRGCRLAVYVEYVPVSGDSQALAPGAAERELLEAGIRRQRARNQEMVLLSFPGDEKASGGCIAAGRGFFHINSHGDVEPCPFSPYSDINIRDSSLQAALQSKLFADLRNSGMLAGDHAGGCVLFEQQEQVERLLIQGEKQAEPGCGAGA